ncbi:ATP-dependent DNA helicase RecG [Pseudarthrobacter sp. J1763]|uniref:ATP-dependent DNA helicase RecG n=1 Tax=Pseudarthrobacter sp. J1763 TaxID=3420445 RepID=UPI003D2BAB17
MSGDPTSQSLDRVLGKRAATMVEKHLGYTTAGELLHHFPRRYLNRGELTPIAEVPLDEDVTLIARVISSNTRHMRARKGTLTDVIIADDQGPGLQLVAQATPTLKVSFFNGFRARNELVPGTLAMFSGKVTRYANSLSLTNPDFLVIEESPGHGTGDSNSTASNSTVSNSILDAEALAKQPIPIYPATAKLTSWAIQKLMVALLEVMDLDAIPDPLAGLAAESSGSTNHQGNHHKVLPLAQAYRLIHTPNEPADWARAQARFRYQEAVVLQTALARRRAEVAAQEATSRKAIGGGLLETFTANLPFTLTAGQQSIAATLAHELERAHPMNRLLQGEVGSGKTIVALLAMLQVVDAGGQAVLLAPTEVLAAQHFDSIRRTLGALAADGLFGGLSSTPTVQLALLTGSMPTAARKQSLLDAASGTAGIIIGTHALLSENVVFFDLGLIVVDEQHRFGVEQRDALRAKAHKPPHLLVMTATPIPRTVAMTVFGDLETSILDELPAGRAPITTHVVGLAENPTWAQRLWQRSREEIDAGHQVYVVCPKIGDNDDGDFTPGEFSPSATEPDGENNGGRQLASVSAVVEHLTENPALAEVPMAPLHGRLAPEEKQSTMAAFAANQVKLLVSTTVIEVGVDVHNATLMIILDADRFGISQLHQLRGRVGRGGLPGTCLLVTSLEPGHPSRQRLDAVASTTDGFQLSHEDLKLRREGDILGASQSGGRSTLRFLRVLEHGNIIERAREQAQSIVADDPSLERHTNLARAIENYLNPEKEAFLERG